MSNINIILKRLIKIESINADLFIILRDLASEITIKKEESKEEDEGTTSLLIESLTKFLCSKRHHQFLSSAQRNLTIKDLTSLYCHSEYPAHTLPSNANSLSSQLPSHTQTHGPFIEHLHSLHPKYTLHTNTIPSHTANTNTNKHTLHQSAHGSSKAAVLANPNIMSKSNRNPQYSSSNTIQEEIKQASPLPAFPLSQNHEHQRERTSHFPPPSAFNQRESAMAKERERENDFQNDKRRQTENDKDKEKEKEKGLYQICVDYILFVLYKMCQNFNKAPVFIVRNYFSHLENHSECSHYSNEFYKLLLNSKEMRNEVKENDFINRFIELLNRYCNYALRDDKSKYEENSLNKLLLSNLLKHSSLKYNVGLSYLEIERSAQFSLLSPIKLYNRRISDATPMQPLSPNKFHIPSTDLIVNKKILGDKKDDDKSILTVMVVVFND